MSSQTLYENVVDATAVYLGPAADRFITRQIVNHLDKAPEKLKKDDLKQLIKWIKPAIALLTEDGSVVDEYVSHLTKLADKRTRS